MMLSEKVYWGILIAVFIGIALLIWLWFVPVGFVEYNLGVNLFTSSIFMVFTIVFLSWFVTLRERIQWKAVREEVYLNIKDCISTVFNEIFDIVEGGIHTKASLLGIEDNKARENAAFSELCRLKELREIKLDPIMFDVTFGGKGSQEVFSSISRELGDLQVKYSKFLSPHVTFSLMRVQQCLRAFEYASRLSITQKETSEMTKLLDNVQRKWRTDMKTISHGLVSVALKRLVDEIYNISESKEIGFWYQ